jgi:dihydrolipoamide dehydrogenase
MAEPKRESTRLAVVGAGPGGYTAAFLAADLGVETVLIDPEPNPGGVCLYRGCIPSKTLLHLAGVIGQARDAARWGVNFQEPEIDLARVRKWKEEVVARLVGGLGVLNRRRGIRYIQGRARFLDAQTVDIQTSEGDRLTLGFEHAILATGSRPIRPSGLFPESRSGRVLDSTAALELPDVPERLLVVGGGYIGLELGSVYAALGSRVSVVEMTDGLLPGVDRDLVRPLAKRLETLLEKIALKARVSSLEEGKQAVRVRFEGEQAPEGVQEFDRVLVSVGRRPNTEDLGLEKTRVRLDENGFVRVDPSRRTDEPSIFAIGDAAGQPLLAHKATHEGRTAAEVIAGRRVSFEPRAIPAVVFTDPEVAWCGLTETQAKERRLQVEICRFPWSASGRAVTLDRTDGLTKLVAAAEGGRLLGVGITGVQAGEMISEGVLAVEMGASAEDLSLSIHPHPTLSETLMEAAELLFGTSTHLSRPAPGERKGRAGAQGR